MFLEVLFAQVGGLGVHSVMLAIFGRVALERLDNVIGVLPAQP